MQVEFREEAEKDLAAIRAYFEQVAPETVERILTDINRGLERLASYPRSGMRLRDRPLRRLVTLKYHFKIVYQIEIECIVVFGLFRFQDREV